MELSEPIHNPLTDSPISKPAPFSKVMELLIVKCNLCGADDYKLVDTQRGFRMVQCRRCGLVYLNPRPLPAWFENACPDPLPTEVDAIARWNRAMEPIYAATRLMLVHGFPAAGRLLEVGCAFGRFLEIMRGGGWQVEGLESDPSAATACRRHGLKVRNEPLLRAEFGAICYDAATMFHAIERLQDPLAGLRKLHAALKPGGMIVVRFPHRTPLVRALKWLGLRTQLFDAPFNLYDFSPRAMTAALERVGFENVRIEIGPPMRPHALKPRLVASTGARLGRWFQWLSGGSYLLPGVSKMAFAEKP
jgi:SAM-dependent methyltransferase